MNTTHRQTGFTLVEAVIVITISGIIATMIAVFITRPVEGYADLSRRAELVDLSEQALKRMQREIRQGLPNSIRIKPLGAGAGQVLELLRVRAGGRYRKDPGGAGYSAAECRLSFNPSGDDSFAIMGEANRVVPVAGDQIVISNWNATGSIANAYSGDNITPSTSTLSFTAGGGTCNEDTIGISPAFNFPYESPQQRFYLVDTPVTYLCDINAGTLRRYNSYTINLNQSDIDTDGKLAAAGASSDLVVDGITACNFTYSPGSPTRSGLVTIAVAVSRQGENIYLQQQFHVSNIP